MTDARKIPEWMGRLEEEDWAFIQKFILASGSLKEMAKVYHITYPTIRLRMDRLIERIKIYESKEIKSDFERTLRAHYAEGRMDKVTFKNLLKAHLKDLKKERNVNRFKR